MATTSLVRELRRVDWAAAEWRASLLCLPAIAIALIAGLASGHRFAALVMAGSAQSVGFGAFQRRLWFRGGPMVLATLGMALSAAVGELAAHSPWIMIGAVTFWAFCYGMSGAISSPASWVGQQCCIFLVISSAVPGTPQQAAVRAAGVLAGGFFQFLGILLLWQFFAPARTTYSDPVVHAPGWQRRAVLENLRIGSSIFRYALLLALTGAVAESIAAFAHFHNAYWIPMTALIIMKPDLLLTNARAIARLGGTLAGAALATLLAGVLRPDGIWLSLLIVTCLYFAYALQNVNYALYAVPLTGYIAFILAVGRAPERNTAEYRVVATAIAGAVAMLIHAVYVREELRRVARTFFPGGNRVIYLLCLSELAALTAIFFGLARAGFRTFGRSQQVLRVVVALPLVISGIAHLVIPGVMAQMIPPVFPARTLLVVLSGLAELAGAAGLFAAKTRRSASLCIALLMIAVFPANIFVAGRTVAGISMPPVGVRLFMQMVYIVLVLAAGWGWPVRRRG